MSADREILLLEAWNLKVEAARRLALAELLVMQAQRLERERREEES